MREFIVSLFIAGSIGATLTLGDDSSAVTTRSGAKRLFAVVGRYTVTTDQVLRMNPDTDVNIGDDYRVTIPTDRESSNLEVLALWTYPGQTNSIQMLRSGETARYQLTFRLPEHEKERPFAVNGFITLRRSASGSNIERVLEYRNVPLVLGFANILTKEPTTEIVFIKVLLEEGNHERAQDQPLIGISPSQ